MNDHEFRGVITGYSQRHGKDVRQAIIKTLNVYEGESDSVEMKVFIVPKDCKNRTKGNPLLHLSVIWNDSCEAWRIVRYF